MSTGTPITREGVNYAYRLLLGRAPESETAIKQGMADGTLEALRQRLMDSAEFATRLEADPPQFLARTLADKRAKAASNAAVVEGMPRIVFFHMMKTAGTSLRMRLEKLADNAPVWRFENEGRPRQATPETLAGYRVIMGHFSVDDAFHVPMPRRVFTVLREPAARLVSLYHFMHRHRAEVVADNPEFELPRIAREHSLEQFLALPDPKVREILHNVMTRSLAGDYRLVGRDRYAAAGQPAKAAISGPELLSRALANLFRFDFVAFVERLEEDRPKLMKALGLPDLGPLPRENSAEFESAILEPRPAPVVTPRAERLLSRHTDLDRILYRLAWQQWS